MGPHQKPRFHAKSTYRAATERTARVAAGRATAWPRKDPLEKLAGTAFSERAELAAARLLA